MSRHQLEVVCPNCGHTGLDTINSSRQHPDLNTRTTTTLSCRDCQAGWAVTIRLERLTPPTKPVTACPSRTGYDQHIRNNQPACDRCNVARRVFEARRNAGLPADRHYPYTEQDQP